MFIRQTPTRTKLNGENYMTFRLVTSQREGGKVKQHTILNLGNNFDLPKEDWSLLTDRIESLLSKQCALDFDSVTPEIEALAQRYVSQIILNMSKQQSQSGDGPLLTVEDYQEVEINSLDLIRPRSVGVEHAGLSALTSLGLPEILSNVGLNSTQIACALGSIIGRMAEPGSELATLSWLKDTSALGELLDVDFESVNDMSLYRASDVLVRHQEKIEQQLFNRINDLFSLPTTVTLYDLTNTYFEGDLNGNKLAKRGHSKEKRTDCPLVTLGLVLDGSGFVRRSKIFDGNIFEGTTLQIMLKGLEAPDSAIVIMDRGIATEENVEWLKVNGYRYIVVSRERQRQFNVDKEKVGTKTTSNEIISIQRVISEDMSEVRLYCHSELREKKEAAMTKRSCERFESEIAKLAAGLSKPHGIKLITKVFERLGRIKNKYQGVSQHYTINFAYDESQQVVTSMFWEKTPVNNTQLTHPGVYCLRSNVFDMDDSALWHTYTMLTDLESVFRSLKSELGLRPVFHRNDKRVQGHLFITVLAYQAVQAIRYRLKAHGETSSWATLKSIFSVQRRVTASFKQREGRILHVRKSTSAEPKLKLLYEMLGIQSSPGGIRKMVYGPEKFKM